MKKMVTQTIDKYLHPLIEYKLGISCTNLFEAGMTLHNGVHKLHQSLFELISTFLNVNHEQLNQTFMIEIVKKNL